MAASRRRVRELGLMLLLVLGGVYALASFPWCRVPGVGALPEVVVHRASEHRALEVGAARVEVTLPFPVTTAGYGPPRSVATTQQTPLFVRAVVMAQGTFRFGWVEVELVTAPDTLRQAIKARASEVQLSELWLTASHTHSSTGAYDPRWISEVVGTGNYRSEVEEAWVKAASSALVEATSRLEKVAVVKGESVEPTLNAPRTGDSVDERLEVVRFQGAAPVAQWVVLSAHPTLVPRRTTALSSDYPGLAARAEESAGHGITFVLQRAVGNAVVEGPLAAPEKIAEALVAAVAKIPLVPVTMPADAVLWLASVEVAPPELDASRLVPGIFQAAGRNALCLGATGNPVVSTLKWGPLSWVAVPFEPTRASVLALEAEAPGATVVALTNGYWGYLEPAGVVKAGSGEARRQYYSGDLLDVLKTGVAKLQKHSEGSPPARTTRPHIPTEKAQ
jgi:neutral ceramidase